MKVWAPPTAGAKVANNVHCGLAASGAYHRSSRSVEALELPRNVASTETVFPGASRVPSAREIFRRSSEGPVWEEPAVPSAQLPERVLGACGSGPSGPRPCSSVTESHLLPNVAHVGAPSDASKAALPGLFTVTFTAALVPTLQPVSKALAVSTAGPLARPLVFQVNV